MSSWEAGRSIVHVLWLGEARDWKEDGEEMVEDKSPALTLLERFILTSSNSESTHLHGPRYKLKRGP